ncbi:hydrolase [Thalassotalea profundi]|uniref:Hydrolase n=1 Tax=Thalassotalea profundi TaxID=2036687 RepID=A0ABQ3J4D4_9GAMM|nr:hydrolase [Thalassotalea profundi]GHE99934.1 hydrolase [Thalassotalea profundi]
MLTSSTFTPAWWLSNPHLQTIAAKWFRRNEKINTFREILQLPDHDSLELAWTEIPNKQEKKPIIILLHGLEGSVDSHYAKGMLQALKNQGWIGVLMHFRGCGQHPNKLGRSYHSGDIEDVTYLASLIETRYPASKKAIIGFSLGGNVLANYLAKTVNHNISAGVMICAPFDLASCSKRINKGLSKIYQKYLINMLKNSARTKIHQNKVQHINQTQLKNITTMWDFDNQYTAPLNGFVDAQDYYHQASGKPLLNKINTPCLVLHAQDDPFLCHNSTIEQLDLNDNVHFEVSQKGGHVGFISGNNPLNPMYWLEHRVPQYLTRYL